jgi:hypothetical protein
MDLYHALETITFVMIMISIIATIWTYITYKKEQMQANLFLRYDYFRKSSIIFFIAIAIYLTMNSLDNLGIKISTNYLAVKDIVVIILVLASLYYFMSKVRTT